MEAIKMVADPYPPYQYFEDGIIKGVDHDVIAASFRQQGVETKTRLLTWDECITSMDTNEADGIFQIQATLERKKSYLFSKPLRTARTVIFQNIEHPVDQTAVKNLAQLLEKITVGTISGYSYDPLIDSLKGQQRVILGTQEDLLNALAQSDIDAAVVDLGVGTYLSGKLGLDNIMPVQRFEMTRVLHVAFRKNLKHIVEIFDAGFEEILKSGIRDRTFSKYGVTG